VPYRFMGRDFSLRVHLITFGIAILIPVTVIAGVLLARSATLERAQLETRLLQVASGIAGDIDRDIARDITLLETLASMASFSSGDWSAFHAQATAGLQGKAYVVVVDPQ
jgi:hypothetical protein